MHIERLTVGPFAVNAYLVWSSGPEALVIDPGADTQELLEHLAARKLMPAAYLLTHGHGDHTSGLGELLRASPAPIFLRSEDRAWAWGPLGAIPPHYAGPGTLPEDAVFLPDEGEIELAGLRWQVIPTPGHSPGAACFYFPDEGVLFTGDTLFKDSVGRTDFPGGSSRILRQSLDHLTTLPPETRVLPGHGEETTIGAEKKSNPFLQRL